MSVVTLGIETSCDETAVALVEDGRRILSSVVSSQVAAHAAFGGVVPEIAAREHVVAIVPVMEQALAQAGVRREAIQFIAVTERPGLQSALLSGVASAEALGLALDRPVMGVNHVEAHLIAPFLAEEKDPTWPLISLVVSGGHTHLFLSHGIDDHRLLGATLDDAAGEAFDKVAKVLGLGYPGGPAIQKAAESGRADALKLKRPYLSPTSLDFSFSGLKTAVLYNAFGRQEDGRPGTVLKPGLSKEDVAASFQATVVDVLDRKLRRAVAATGVNVAAVGGGVACNGPLRERLQASAKRGGFELYLPRPALCTDNAAMVAALGGQRFMKLGPKALERDVAVAPRATWPRPTPEEGLGDCPA